MATQKSIDNHHRSAPQSIAPKDTDKTHDNSTWHGLRGSRVVLDNESMDEYNAMSATLYSYFQPIGTYEHNLVKRIADRSWELERVVAMKSDILNRADYRDLRLEELARLERYESSIERSLVRVRHELTQVQRLRGRFTPEQKEAQPLTSPHTPGILVETQQYIGPHAPVLYSQGEIAMDHLLSRAVRELKSKTSPNTRDAFLATLTQMADHRLQSEQEEGTQL